MWGSSVAPGPGEGGDNMLWSGMLTSTIGSANRAHGLTAGTVASCWLLALPPSNGAHSGGLYSPSRAG
eukprot:1079779-Pyramimonas_sp.AAC.1